MGHQLSHQFPHHAGYSLHYSLPHYRCGFVSRVKILLQFKVKVDLPNNKKELPIHRACTSDKNMEVWYSMSCQWQAMSVDSVIV